MKRDSTKTLMLFYGFCLYCSLAFYPAMANAEIHGLFDQVLGEHVKDGHVDYDSIKHDQRFYEYLDILKQVNIDDYSSRDEKLAFWINSYNALAIQGILENRSPSSFFGRAKYFISTKYQLAKKEISLNQLEKEIIIPFADPRIHFAIVCASYSCPKLRAEAYIAERLDMQLDESAKNFINDPTKNEYNTSKRTANISKIFDWFESDFSTNADSVSNYIARYINIKELAMGLKNNNYRIKHLKYNWSLNGNYSK